MTSTLVKGGLLAALLGASAAAHAGEEVGGGLGGEAGGVSAAARVSGPVRHHAPESTAARQANFPSPSRSTLAATGKRLAEGQAATPSGPAYTYRTSRRGPVLEIAALGGGEMDNAPFLAHLGLGWKF